MTIGIVKPVRIEDEMKGAYLDYAMSVITARALPDVRDGLKPVQRRILYSMDELGLRPTAAYKKSARIVGEVMGKYHPHGDAPVYEAMVRMAQDFSMRYPLVDGQGNFGSVDGDPPAAMRYTEARLTPLADEMLADIDKNTVNFSPNFDDTLKEPTVLPSKLPNLLVNGSSGIAVGMATNIPPHNLVEVTDALTHVIGRLGEAINGGVPFGIVWARAFNNPADLVLARQGLAGLRPALKQRVDAAVRKLGAGQGAGEEHRAAALVEVVDDLVDVDPARLMEFVKGPDFPTAGIILGAEGIKNAYATGHGRITIRAKAHSEDMRGGRKQIVITELPFQVNKASLLEKIAELVRDRRVEGISELRDESDRQGMRVVIELRREAHPRQILNQLFKYTAMQTAFSVNMLALVDGQPRVLTLKMVLLHYLNHRREVITRRTEFDLAKARHRAHILEGLKIALDNLDEVIATIRRSKDAETARTALMKGFKLSEAQAQAILDMQLRRLAALERQKIRDELAETLKLIKHLEELLANPVKILYLIRDELAELKTKFGDARRTQIIEEETADFTEEDLVPDQEMLVTLTAKGYVKRALAEGYRTQRRGAKGISGAISKEDDPPLLFTLASSRDNLLLLSNRGRTYQVKVLDLPEVVRQARGLPVGNFVTLDEQERIVAALPTAKLEGRFLVLATHRGEVKRISATEFSSARPSGIAGYAVPDGDELIGAVATSGHQDILLATTNGQAIRFGEAELRPSGRGSGGVRGIKLGDNDRVASIDIVSAGAFVAVVTRKGFGKRTPIDDFSKQGRGGGGIRAANVSVKNGEVVAGRVVSEADELVLVSSGGTVLRQTASALAVMGRSVIGVPVMTLARDEKVLAVGVVPPKDKTDEPAKSGAPPAGGDEPSPDGGEGATMGDDGTAQSSSSSSSDGTTTSSGKPAKSKAGGTSRGAAQESQAEGGSEMLPGARLAKSALRRAAQIVSGAKTEPPVAEKRGRGAKTAASAKPVSKVQAGKPEVKSSKSTAATTTTSAVPKTAKPRVTPKPSPATASAGPTQSDSARSSGDGAKSAPGTGSPKAPSSIRSKLVADHGSADGNASEATHQAPLQPGFPGLGENTSERPFSNPIPPAAGRAASKAQSMPAPPTPANTAARNFAAGNSTPTLDNGASAAQDGPSKTKKGIESRHAATAKSNGPDATASPKSASGKTAARAKPGQSPTLLKSVVQTLGSGLKAAQADLNKRSTENKKGTGRKR